MLRVWDLKSGDLCGCRLSLCSVCSWVDGHARWRVRVRACSVPIPQNKQLVAVYSLVHGEMAGRLMSFLNGMASPEPAGGGC